MKTVQLTNQKYRIQSFARLHCGLINMSGLFNRVHGGFGFSLCEPYWDIEMGFAENFKYEGVFLENEYHDQIEKICKKFYELSGGHSFFVNCYSKIDSHIGLGSKTSLSLSVSKLASKLLGLKIGAHELAKLVGRGGTSGIGVNAFENGGFIIDLGHNLDGENSFVPSSISRLPAPKQLASLKVNKTKIVHFRFSEKGVFGYDESQLFLKKCPLPHYSTKEIICNLFFNIIPGLVEKDNKLLQHGLRVVQNIGFKKNEWEAQSEIEKDFAIFWKKKRKDDALCLSSMGSTLFYVGNEIEDVLTTIEEFGVKPVHLTITDINNKGNKITNL